MKNYFLLALLGFMTFHATAFAQNYDTYFSGERLRIDLVFYGNNTTQHAALKNMHKEPVWAGTRTQLISPFRYGEYQCEAYLEADSSLIFSNGFCSLFQEWRTTAEAGQRSKAFDTSFWMPFPKQPILFKVLARNALLGTCEPLYECRIDPEDLIIHREAPVCQTEDLEIHGACANKVDLLFMAEGYTAAEMDKFRADATRFTEYLFSTEPYASRREDFNIRILPIPSAESGPDIPQHNLWRNTALGAAFNTFYIDRYMTIPDYLPVADAVRGAAFDALYIIANTDKYGGGGIYNYYGMSMADHATSRVVFVHEFGHSFAGLADEYFSSQVAYNDMYPLHVEPWEPNITTKVNFASKWADMMDTEGVGLFEGGGYTAKGVFRPADVCRMRDNTCPGFCPVCLRAINRMIDYYTK